MFTEQEAKLILEVVNHSTFPGQHAEIIVSIKSKLWNEIEKTGLKEQVNGTAR